MTPEGQRTYKYYDFVMAAFVTVLLCANLIGASKVATLFGFTFGAGVLFFPISYIFGDILTEVYGYARSRRVVWTGFAALLFASLMSLTILAFPPAAGWPHQAAFETVFGNTWRIAARVDVRVPVRRVLQLVRAREDEDQDARDGSCGCGPSARRSWARPSTR